MSAALPHERAPDGAPLTWFRVTSPADEHATVLIHARGREDAKRRVRRLAPMNPDQYIVEPLVASVPSPGVRANETADSVATSANEPTSVAPSEAESSAGETDQRTWIVVVCRTHGSIDCPECPNEDFIQVVPKSERDRALRERDEAREALQRIHDGLADHPRWHDINPRFEGPMDVARFAREALGAAGSEEENRV